MDYLMIFPISLGLTAVIAAAFHFGYRRGRCAEYHYWRNRLAGVNISIWRDDYGGSTVEIKRAAPPCRRQPTADNPAPPKA